MKITRPGPGRARDAARAVSDEQEHVARGIVRAGWEAVRGELPTPNEHGYCLKLVRLIIERAMGWQDSELYRRYVDRTWVAPPDYPHASGHWARDLERALRDAGMAVSGDRSRPGDILCNYEAAWSRGGARASGTSRFCWITSWWSRMWIRRFGRIGMRLWLARCV